MESLEARLLLATYNGTMPNVGMELRSLHDRYVAYLEDGGNPPQFAPDSGSQMLVRGNAVYSTIRTSGEMSDVLTVLADAGFQLMATAAHAGILEGYLPLGALETVAAASGVVSVMPIIRVQPTDSEGSTVNEAESVLLADSAKGLFDINGAGVTVGVISDSADQVDGGLADSVATGDLPPGIPLLRPEPSDGTDEGRAMLELIYDIAPGAALAFASGIGGDAAMAAAINALVGYGATIVVDDLNGLTTEPFFEDGLAAQAVTAAVASGVTYFSSAGNRGTSGYEAPLNLQSYNTDPFPNIPTLNAGKYHDWNGSNDLTQTITLGTGITTIVFQYDEPFGGVVSDFDVFLLNGAGTQILDAAIEFNPATGEPREILTYNNTTGAPITAQMVIQEFGGNTATRFKWIGFNDPVVGEHLGVAGALNNPHNPGHNGTADAISVAAAWWQTPLTIQSYSSRGPVTRSLDTAGNPIPLQIINKPVLTAVDGTSTSVPGFASFFGTSAAAPNAAAVAALVKSFDLTLAPPDLRNTLIASAIDIAPAGFDLASGAGLIQTVDAILVLTGGELPLAGDRDVVNQNDTFVLVANSGDSSVLDVSLNGTFLGSVAMSKLTKITVDGRGGSDTLVVDQSQGLITVPIEYEGGFGASDRLVHTGDPGVPMQGRYTPAPGTATGHAGVLSYNGGAVTISFTGLEPVEDLVPAAALVVDDAIDANIVNVVDGPLSSVPDPVTGGTETTYEINFAGLAESIQFRNKGVVTVNGLGGDDAFTVNIGPRSTADALTQIVLNGDAGGDTVNVIQSRIGEAAGAVFAALAVQTAADADTITIVPSTAGSNARVTDAVTVQGGGGAGDVLLVDDRLNATADTWTVTGTSLTRPSFGGATYTGVVGVTLLAQNTVGATVDVPSTSVATTINAGGGGDTLNVGGGDLSNIVGNLTLIGGPGTDQVVVSDSARVAPAAYSVAPTSVAGPNPGSITYDATTENLTLLAGAGADTISVAPSLNTAYTIAGNNPVFFTSPGDQLTVDLAGPGSGTVLITGPGAGSISFPGGYRAVAYTSIEFVSAVNGVLDLVIEGDAGANEFRVALDPSGANLQVFREGVLQFNAPKNVISNLAVSGLAGNDVLIVDGQNGLPTFAGALGAGFDNPNIPGVPSLLFDGGADADRVVFRNLAAGFDQTYAIGDGVGGGSGATTSEGEILTSAGSAALQMYFVDLEPVLTTSVGGDTLTVIGDPTDNVFQVVPSPLIAGGTRVQETAGPYESFDFAPGAFTTLRIFGHDGADLLDLVSLGGAEAALSLIVLDGRRDTLADDNAEDTLRVRNNTRGGDGAGVAVELYGGGGDDLFQLFDADPDVDGLLGTVLVNGNAGDDTLIVDDTASAGPSETVTITATTIAGITGPGGTGGLITYVNLNAGRLQISMNDAGHTLSVVSTAAGLTETELNTGGGDDVVNIDDDLANPLAGTANGVVSPIDLNAQAGDDTLNIIDLSDASDNQYHMDATTIGGGDFGAAVTPGGIFGPDGILFYDSDLEAIDVLAGDGTNEFNIDATGVGGTAPTARVTITDGSGGSEFNIQADQLAPDADHTFNGQDAPDVFNVYVAAGAVVTGASVQINGQADNDDTSSRDFVRVLDGGGARTVTMTYQSAASGDVVIGIDGGTLLDIRTTEQVLFAGDAANDDVVTVRGTAGDDDLTVAPFSASEALIFLNGNPWDGPVDADPFGSAYPGIAGGGSGPDILVQGVRQTGLTIRGNGAAAGDQLYVYAPSEDPVVDPATTIAPFDLLGVGVIVPGFGVGNAYDDITVTDARVTVVNGSVGPLLDVNVDTASFVQLTDDKVHGLIVNAGFEAVPAGSGIADDIVAVLSYNFAMKINGGDPVPAFAPQGDRLAVVTPGEINVFSDKSTPPEVTITTTNPVSGQTSKGLSFSSIENVVLTPGLTSQMVNLIGDNNDPAVDQNDRFVVVGAEVDSLLPSLAGLAGNPAYNPTGAPVDPRFDVDTDGDNEFYLWINGSTPIAFRNVVFLNVYGDDQNPPPGTPSAGPDDIDTLELTPYADNTPTSWGIDVRFDEGNPVQADGAAADLLIYHTAVQAGVSENIVIQPSGPEQGELRATNGAFGTPIVAISYTTNLDIVVLDDDGDLSDTDTLTLRGTNPDNVGTSGAERVTADFTAAGDVANPLVVVADANPVDPLQPLLYRLRDMQGFDTVTIDTLGGLDTVQVTGRDDGSLLVRLSQADAVALPGVANGNDRFDIFTGAVADA
ncbi:MAG: S8 family serine peptidase, partial [Pirellulaceae bacterium]|nr:S8 family serine peptidase [Pirellulaceae bacterium]